MKALLFILVLMAGTYAFLGPIAVWEGYLGVVEYLILSITINALTWITGWKAWGNDRYTL